MNSCHPRLVHPTPNEFSLHCPHNQISLSYFFGKLTSADWIDPLTKAGCLRTPPLPQETENGIMLPSWPVSQYLARVASQAPDEVLKIILTMEETSNSRVHSDLIDALCAMPRATAAKAKDRVVQWIESTNYLRFPDEFARLIVHVAKGGRTSAALQIARSLLALRQAGNGASKREPVARYGNWEYQETKCSQPSAVCHTC